MRVNERIERRVLKAAEHIALTGATVRQTARLLGVSKSTVHKDVAERLSQINPTLAAEARKVLDVNKSERHIRGGMATKEKYLHMEKKTWWGIS
jgi:putative DeoR family transcriptional regulator (stage III sporulation protein D)